MDDAKPNDRKPSKRTGVLRARDVIPPFDGSAPLLDDGRPKAERSHLLPSPTGGSGGERAIPAYNLAENILAAQRRVAGRRRRGPGRAESTPVAPLPGTGPVLPAPDWAGQDLSELQRIVAEIVARDIQRLCRGPETPAEVRA